MLTKKAIIQIFLNNGNDNSGGSIFHEQLLTKNSDNSSATNAQINLNKKKLQAKNNSDNSIASNVNITLI